MKYSNAVVAHLDGGFGNQLFIFAAALAQARRLDCKLVIDASEYSRSSQIRSFELNFLNELADDLITSASFSRKIRLRRSSSLKSVTSLSFRERNPLIYEANINRIKPGTTLRGYFQAPAYFETVAEELFSYFQAEKNRLDIKQESREQINIHFRRGDYLQPENAKFHGLISPNYVKNSVSLLNQLGINGPVIVYSDEPEVAQREISPFLEDATYNLGINESPLEAMLRLSNASALIMSNSSFSWWAGWLMTYEKESKVVAPRPWFQNGSAAANLLFPEWITLGAI